MLLKDQPRRVCHESCGFSVVRPRAPHVWVVGGTIACITQRCDESSPWLPLNSTPNSASKGTPVPKVDPHDTPGRSTRSAPQPPELRGRRMRPPRRPPPSSRGFSLRAHRSGRRRRHRRTCSCKRCVRRRSSGGPRLGRRRSTHRQCLASARLMLVPLAARPLPPQRRRRPLSRPMCRLPPKTRCRTMQEDSRASEPTARRLGQRQSNDRER